MGAADPAWHELSAAVRAYVLEYILDIRMPLELEIDMSIGGLKFAETLTRDQYAAYGAIAREALEAWTVGERIHVSGASELDLQELIDLCDEQVRLFDAGEPRLGVRWPLRALMRAMTPAMERRMAEAEE